MGLMSEAQRAGRWSQKATRDGDSDDSAMQWALSSLSHGGVYRHLEPRSHRRTQTGRALVAMLCYWKSRSIRSIRSIRSMRSLL